MYNLDPQLYKAIVEIVDHRMEEIKVTRQDFNSLKDVVEELAQAQKRTEERVEELAQAQKRTEERVEELAQAQKRTEERVEELAQAQKRTEERVEELAQAQKESEKRMTSLEIAVEKLAQAQLKTEIAVQRLDNAVEKLQNSVQRLDKTVGTISSRWGIFVEDTFRSAMKEILEKEFNAKVEEKWLKDYQIDLIIKDGKHILIEITSSTKKEDITNLLKASEIYFNEYGIKPKLMVVTAYVPPKLLKIVYDNEIEIFSHE